MSSHYQLDFEKPIRELERRIEQLEREQKQGQAAAPSEPGLEPAGVAAAIAEADVAGVRRDEAGKELARLRQELERELARVYSSLTAWDTVRVARHPDRPQTRDYIMRICKDFCELHGDRRYADDPALVCGLARIGSHKCVVIGHQKGRTTEEKIACHWGCAHPEGYRKALRAMKLAEKFGLPVVTLVDTQGAFPGIGAEQRGQAEAIAVNLREMSRLKTPIVSVVIGEGGSGGALGIAVADAVGMMQHAWYSVISPEGCAAILWKQASEQTNTAAANALKLTAADNLKLGIIDAVIPEPAGGAHRDHAGAARALEHWVIEQLDRLKKQRPEAVTQARYKRFRKLGEFQEAAAVTQAESEAQEIADATRPMPTREPKPPARSGVAADSRA